MSRHLFIILSFALAGTIDHCCAQDINKGDFETRAKKTNTARPQQKATISKPAVKPVLNLITNEDCIIKIGEVNYGSLLNGNKRTIPLARGKYTLTATSTQGAYQYVTELNMADTTVLVQIDLAKIIAAAKTKADSLAKQQEKNVAVTPPPVNKKPVETDEKAAFRARIKAAVDTLLSDMVPIAAGSYTMGNNLGDNDEGPEHMVNIRAFKFSKYEVTQQQWETVMRANPSINQGCATCPVENVSIGDIDSFITIINKISSRKFRLPSEAEWEYVAKKGGVFKDVSDRAWYNSNSGKVTRSIGTKWPNALGIFDMSGNVAEWCSDWYANNYYKKKSVDNPVGPESGEKKVVRGGAYTDSESTLRLTHRDKQDAGTKKGTIGFRLVMDER